MSRSPIEVAERTHALPAPHCASERKPLWLKVRSPGGSDYASVKRLMREMRLNTVCEEARCPNLAECWQHRTATFMILGDVCTRNCAYCAVAHGTPPAPDPDEPRRLAEAAARMRLRHVVITSVDRDDLPNGGAESFASCVHQIRSRMPHTTVEVLIPDFRGSDRALGVVLDAEPDILNHNLETVERLYPIVRPGGRYHRTLHLLAMAKELRPTQPTKSGIICGLGEEWDELLGAMRALRQAHVDILNLGQYLRPTRQHASVARFYSPEDFVQLAHAGREMGFMHVEAGPLVRSSYRAWEQARQVTSVVE